MKPASSMRLGWAFWMLAAALLAQGGLALAQVAPLAAAAPASQPTVDDIQAAIDAKLYTAAVKTAAKLLALHGPAAAGQDRFAIMMLKGFAHAGLRANSTAVVTFRSAQKETQDPGQIALAKWTATLFQTAGSSTFVPKTNGPAGIGAKRGPFDLLNPDQRKQAFGALLDDNLTLIEPKLKQATISQKLPEIWPVLQQVLELDQLDIIADGNDDKTQTIAGSLLEHSRNLLSNALKADWARVSDIDTHANTTSTSQQQVYINNTLVEQTITKKNGLSDYNRNELNNIIAVCQKIHDAAEVFMSAAKSDTGWTTILSDSDRVAGRASDVLSADYGTAVSTSSETNTTLDGYPIGTGQNAQFPANTNTNTNTPPVNPPKKPAPPAKPTKPGSGS